LDGEVIDAIETAQDGSYSFDYLAPGSYTVREVRQAGWIQTYPPGGSHSVTLIDADSMGNDFGNHQIMSEDTEPPEIVSFDFDPKAVDTSTSSQEITATARLTDDLSGFSSASAWFESPSGGQSVGVSLSSNDRISGDKLDGVYEDTMTLLQYSEPGTWKLDYISLSDNVGNRKRLSEDDAKALGFPTEFEVESVGDTEPPNVLSFDFDPKAVDTSTSSQEITATARLTDDLSGFSSASVWFESPSGGQSVGVSLSSNDRISGDELDGVYEDTMTLPQYSEPGTWKLDYISLSDSVGNRKRLSEDDAAAFCFPTMFRNGHSGAFSISGMKFNDLDNNSAKDSGESGLPGWTIELLLDGEVIDSTETAADGSYYFDHLAPGSYTVREVRQAGWIQTYPQGGTHSVNLVDADSTGNDFGNHQIMNEDTEPPDIVSFDFDPKAIDTSASSQKITFTARLTDDLSGVNNAMMWICIPEGCHQRWGSSIGSYNLVSGDTFDGVYKSEMTIPRYSHQGIWKLYSIDIYDKVGNQRVITRDEMESLGFPTEFEVISDGDNEPPNIVDMNFDPKSVDTSASSQCITFTTHLTDDLSGIYSMQTWFQSPSGEQSTGFRFWSAEDLISGDTLDGVYVSKVRLPQYSEKGIWKLDYVHISDKVHNNRWLSQSDIADLGFPTEFEVVSDGDTEPPNVVSFNFDPKHVDTSTSHQDIIFRMGLTDDLSGVASFSGQFKSLSGDQYVSFGASSISSSLISGDEIDGIYECTMTLPQYSKRGTWQLEGFSLVDNVGNQRWLSKDDMTALGFPIEFQNNPSYSGLSINKTASPSSVSPGDLLNYTIIYTNTGDVRLTEVVITERYPAGVEFISASPAPDPDTKNRWTIGDLPVDGTGKIIVTVRVSELQDLEFTGEGRITGEGFVNVRESLSTSRGPIDLKNTVTITSAETGPVSAAASVTVGDPGTELETREHGSGTYESEEQVRLRTENKSISMEKDVAATYAPTTLGLYRNRTATYSSKWTEEALAKNRITGASMSESYRYATNIDRESRMILDENESVMEVEAEFDGMGHVGFLKMPSNSSTPKTTPTFEAREDYTGSFKVLERVDEYGSSVTSEKSASGTGLVAVDKRVGESQRSHESGAGAYDSEELIETNTNYIAKDLSVVSGPMNQSLTDDVSIDASQKWKEGMYSKTAGTSYIGEEYTSITSLDKETIALGLNEMDTEANFSGRARYRAILKNEVDFDEQYEGDYSLQRRILFTGVPKYDRPHLTVVKNGSFAKETIFDAKETTLAGESRDKVITVATYTITIENDGNKALGPIYVRDLFPPKAVFINASVRPSELTDSYANWTLTHLAIGDVLAITLNLDVTKHVPSELVNRVEVCGGYNGDEQVCASNFSALEVEWLSCYTDETILVRKTGQGASSAKNRVLYRIEIENRANVTRVATVTDNLPEGMVLIDSSIPFASYENETVVWNLAEIRPFETVTIDYMAEALWSGRFENSVEVDDGSVDGPIVQPVRANSVIEIGEFGGERRPAGWQPPDWGFVSVCDENCELTP